MTKTALYIRDCLNQRLIVTKDIWFEYDIPGARFSGWYMKDDKSDTYYLGRNKTQAAENIEINNLKKIDDDEN
jgi:hypothetical protein